MTELLTNIEALIAMSAPIVLSMFIQFSNFIVVYKKLMEQLTKVIEDEELNQN